MNRDVPAGIGLDCFSQKLFLIRVQVDHLAKRMEQNGLYGEGSYGTISVQSRHSATIKKVAQ